VSRITSFTSGRLPVAGTNTMPYNRL